MSNGVAQLVPLVVLLVLAYMLLVRLPRKRAREVSQLQAALSVGDQIMLTSGIFARVVAMADDKLDVEISPGVVVTIHRGAIGSIVRDAPDGDVGGADPLPDEGGRTGSSLPARDADPSSQADPVRPADGEPGLGAY